MVRRDCEKNRGKVQSLSNITQFSDICAIRINYVNINDRRFPNPKR